MGYGGKHQERARARELRAQSWTLAEIAEHLGVSKSSVSVWVRDVDFVPKPRNRGHAGHQPHPLHVRKLEEIERCRVEADEAIGELSERDLRMFALGLYAGEGAKTRSCVSMANTNPQLLRVFMAWLRADFDIDESRMRAKLYLHHGLDLDAATRFWSDVLEIPVEQFGRPYRAVADGTIRHTKHECGCATASYSSALIHRRVMALIATITSRFAHPG